MAYHADFLHGSCKSLFRCCLFLVFFFWFCFIWFSLFWIFLILISLFFLSLFLSSCFLFSGRLFKYLLFRSFLSFNTITPCSSIVFDNAFCLKVWKPNLSTNIEGRKESYSMLSIKVFISCFQMLKVYYCWFQLLLCYWYRWSEMSWHQQLWGWITMF